MNRGKFWSYLALTLVAGIANLVLVSRALTHRVLDDLDREQKAAATQVDARAQLLAADAERLAEAVARDPATIQALSPDAPGVGDVAAAPRAALDAARTMGFDASRPLLVATSGREGRSATVNGQSAHLEHGDSLFPGAGAGAARREGYALTDRGIWYAVAVPAGRGAVAVGLPVDATWLASLKSATGSDVTLAVEGRKPLSTLSPRDVAVVEAAARARPVSSQSAGSLGREGPSAGSVPLLFTAAPAFRVHALALKGTSGVLALSMPAAPLLADLASYQWTLLGALVALALVGVALGLLITNEQAALVPKALTNAADRISRGDFAARAPIMAGSLGTIATALNKAAEAAEAAARPPPPWEGPTSQLPAASDLAEGPTEQISPADAGIEHSETTPLAGHEWVPPQDAGQAAIAAQDAEPREGEPFGSQEAPLEEPAPAQPAGAVSQSEATGGAGEASLASGGLEERGAEPLDPTQSLSREERAATGDPYESQTGDLLAAAAAVTPLPEAAPAPEPAVPEAAVPEAAVPEAAALASAAAAPAAPVAAASATPAPASGVSTADEDHWSSVYQEFIRVRRDCGELGVPYPRFRNKLQQNRDHLVAKYRCKTVRFQVYVKEGKAALKASPVR